MLDYSYFSVILNKSFGKYNFFWRSLHHLLYFTRLNNNITLHHVKMYFCFNRTQNKIQQTSYTSYFKTIYKMVTRPLIQFWLLPTCNIVTRKSYENIVGSKWVAKRLRTIWQVGHEDGGERHVLKSFHVTTDFKVLLVGRRKRWIFN